VQDYILQVKVLCSTFENDSLIVGRAEIWTVGDKWDTAQEAGNHRKGSCHRIVESHNNYHLESVICFVRDSYGIENGVLSGQVFPQLLYWRPHESVPNFHHKGALFWLLIYIDYLHCSNRPDLKSFQQL